MRARRFLVWTALAALLALAVAAPAHAVQFAVDSTLDTDDGGAPNNGCEASGGDECTLREAILAANASGGADSIPFSGSIANGTVINIGTALPQVTGQTSIGNGFGFIKVEINGPGPGVGTVAGLDFGENADDSLLATVSVVDFDRGVVLNGADNVTIESSRVGVTAAVFGAADGNGNVATEGGIHLIGDADGNTIGDQNIIGANAGNGIDLTANTGTGNTITFNRIGTNNNDDAGLGNGGNGIAAGTAAGTTIRNPVIVNSALNGIVAAGPTTTITGSSIGTAGSGDLGNGADGILVTGNGVATIGGAGANEGNTISGNAGDGVKIESNVGGSTLQANAIGTDSTGNIGAEVANAGAGVAVIDSPGNRIGTPGVGNRVANNGQEGIRITDPGSTGNRVESNVVGISGGAPAGNDLEGILVANGPDANVIGSPGGGNVVGNSGSHGIRIADSVTSGNVIQGNLVGVDSNGTTPRGNAIDGISVSNAPATVVGGLAPGAGNTSSGNGFAGIDVENTSDDAVVRGNTIGTNQAGTLGVPNARGLRVEGDRAIVEGNAIAGNITEGIALDEGTGFRLEGNRIGQTPSGATMGNGAAGIEVDDVSGTIGGPGAAANTITGNLGPGILLDDDAARATVAENAIFANGGLGIDLTPAVAGVTPNDPGDADAGANTLQNTPSLTAATVSGGQTAVAGAIASSPATPIIVRFFASSPCDPSGAGEGQTPLGATSVTTDGAGNASFTASLPPTATGDQITATATGPGGTSEFSSCLAVPAGAVTIDPASVRIAEGGRATFTVTRSGSTAQDAVVSVASVDGSARAGADYEALDTAVFFDAGQSSKSVSVAIRDDTAAEGDETLTVALSAPVRAGLGTPSRAAVTIAGNDRGPDSNLARLRSPAAAGKLRRIAGTASDPDGDLARVEVAIFEARSGARAAARPSCRHINARGRAVPGKADARRRCRPRTFLRASGRARWSLRLRRGLPRGTWVIVSRAVDRAGRRETSFTARDRNRAVVRVR